MYPTSNTLAKSMCLRLVSSEHWYNTAQNICKFLKIQNLNQISKLYYYTRFHNKFQSLANPLITKLLQL